MALDVVGCDSKVAVVSRGISDEVSAAGSSQEISEGVCLSPVHHPRVFFI